MPEGWKRWCAVSVVARRVVQRSESGRQTAPASRTRNEAVGRIVPRRGVVPRARCGQKLLGERRGSEAQPGNESRRSARESAAPRRGIPGDDLLSRTRQYHRRDLLNDRVRNGNGCDQIPIVTGGVRIRPRSGACRQRSLARLLARLSDRSDRVSTKGFVRKMTRGDCKSMP